MTKKQINNLLDDLEECDYIQDLAIGYEYEVVIVKKKEIKKILRDKWETEEYDNVVAEINDFYKDKNASYIGDYYLPYIKDYLSAEINFER